MRRNRGEKRHTGAFRAAAICALALAPLTGCGEGEAAVGGGGDFVFRVPVTWVRIEPGEVSETVELVGDVRTRRWSELAFERSGRLIEVLADIGDEVSEGQVLARLDDTVLRRQTDVMLAALAVAEADHAFAQREAERADGAGADILSESERDRRVSAAASTAAIVGQRRADLAALDATLAQGELRAPFDGTIVMRGVTDGTYASVGRTAFTLVDMLHREVHLEIPPLVATGLGVGVPVELRLDERPEFRLSAKLDELVPAANLQTRLFTGVVSLQRLDAERHLLPGMFVRARFDRTREQSQTVVPSDAVLTGADASFVVLIEPPPEGAGLDEFGMPRAPTGALVPVRVLARNAERCAVEPIEPGRLRPGMAVAVTGADNVFPGAPLQPTPPMAASDLPDASGATDTTDTTDTTGAPSTTDAAGATGAAGGGGR